MELAQDLPPSCRSLIKNKQITNECRLIVHLRLWVGLQECPLTRYYPLKKQHRVRWLPFISQLSVTGMEVSITSQHVFWEATNEAQDGRSLPCTTIKPRPNSRSLPGTPAALCPCLTPLDHLVLLLLQQKEEPAPSTALLHCCCGRNRTRGRDFSPRL